MQWEFSPEQVVKGEVSYGLANFRADLATEVEMNSPGASSGERGATFDVLYDLCHWLARGQALEGFLEKYAFDPPTCEFLRDVAAAMRPNADMLGAILQRMIMDGVEGGMSLDDALDRAHSIQLQVVNGGMHAIP
jgi:hypothetical protein